MSLQLTINYPQNLPDAIAIAAPSVSVKLENNLKEKQIG